MADWVDVARVDEFPPGTWRVVEVEGALIAVFNLEGAYYAIEDVLHPRRQHADWRGYRRRGDRLSAPRGEVLHQDGGGARTARVRVCLHLPSAYRRRQGAGQGRPLGLRVCEQSCCASRWRRCAVFMACFPVRHPFGASRGAGHPETARAAEAVLLEGGNAFDACLAAHLTACIAEPLLTSLGRSSLLTRTASGRDILLRLLPANAAARNSYGRDRFLSDPRELRDRDPGVSYRPGRDRYSWHRQGPVCRTPGPR